MTVCNSCGGVVGRDCWNPQECAEITADMQRRALEERYAPHMAHRLYAYKSYIEMGESSGWHISWSENSPDKCTIKDAICIGYTDIQKL